MACTHVVYHIVGRGTVKESWRFRLKRDAVRKVKALRAAIRKGRVIRKKLCTGR